MENSSFSIIKPFETYLDLLRNKSPLLQKSTFQDDLSPLTDYINEFNGYTSSEKIVSENVLNYPENEKHLISDYLRSLLTSEEKPNVSTNKTIIPKNVVTNTIYNSKYNDEDKEYLLKLAGRESNYNPFITGGFNNTYYGLYQFGSDALKTVGYTKKDFDDINKQNIAALKLAKINEKVLSPIMDKYIGKTVNGIYITKNGIRAASHLLGAGTVKDWFSGTKKTKLAKSGFVDGNGTHITEYFNLFT